MNIDATQVFIIIGLLFVLVKAADYVGRAASNMAREFGITEYLIGFFIIALGTSFPELMTSIFGSLNGESNLVLGNLIGANIIDATFVLGIMAIVGRKIKIEGRMFRTFDETLFMTLGLVVLPFLLGLDGELSRYDGAILVFGFILYAYKLIKREERFRHIKRIKWKEMALDILVLIIGIPVMLVSAKFLVDNAIGFAHQYNIATYTMGVIFLAIGTTLPELTMEIRAVMKGRKNVGFGDIIGSIIANISLILGIAALIHPLGFTRTIFITSALFMITSTFVALLFLQKEYVTWKEGLALIMIYITFIISEIILI